MCVLARSHTLRTRTRQTALFLFLLYYTPPPPFPISSSSPSDRKIEAFNHPHTRKSGKGDLGQEMAAGGGDLLSCPAQSQCCASHIEGK